MDSHITHFIFMIMYQEIGSHGQAISMMTVFKKQKSNITSYERKTIAIEYFFIAKDLLSAVKWMLTTVSHSEESEIWKILRIRKYNNIV